jgi:hypothetical protein
VLIQAHTLASRDFDAGQVIVLDFQFVHPVDAASNSAMVASEVAMLVHHRGLPPPPQPCKVSLLCKVSLATLLVPHAKVALPAFLALETSLHECFPPLGKVNLATLLVPHAEEVLPASLALEALSHECGPPLGKESLATLLVLHAAVELAALRFRRFVVHCDGRYLIIPRFPFFHFVMHKALDRLLATNGP